MTECRSQDDVNHALGPEDKEGLPCGEYSRGKPGSDGVRRSEKARDNGLVRTDVMRERVNVGALVFQRTNQGDEQPPAGMADESRASAGSRGAGASSRRLQAKVEDSPAQGFASAALPVPRKM